MTRQRKVVLEEVRLGMHPTADQVYERVRERLPQVSMGTVYRNLDTLVSLGYIRKLAPAHPQMRFDGNITDHYHITCYFCGKIEDIFFEQTDGCFKNLENALGSLTKHGIFGHRLEFVGVCSDCRAKGKVIPGYEKNDENHSLIIEGDPDELKRD